MHGSQSATVATPAVAASLLLMNAALATQLSVLETEDVVVDVVLSRLVRHKLKDLRKVHRVAIINLQAVRQ